MEVLFGDGPEAMTSTMKRMMTFQEERSKRMAAVHARYQAALTAARAQHMARFKEMQRQMESRRARYVAKMADSVQRRRELEAEMLELVRRMGGVGLGGGGYAQWVSGP
ncbi:hypothetical protein GQ602_000363 [Ophiocordyceps camponoti-floridani]|uniref:Uncharacterized protein n=1 Tax=Ophiocordyceps camponoti-floridani TaxID=2030778 RepID=A0A8H4VGC3_9HYPO|nr:hypothetical protein GQ602_000363 [Ophiocordyceps camponoti-floridani]